jgi:polyferredoxin
MKRGLAVLGIVFILLSVLIPVLIPPMVWGAIFGPYWMVSGFFVILGFPIIGIVLIVISVIMHLSKSSNRS